jgi:hypothetical protein
MPGRGRTTLVVMLVGALASACFGPEEKTKLICRQGTSLKLFFSMFNAHGGKHASMDLPATDAAGVCQKMSEAALEMGLKVERISPTEINVVGTDRVTIVYIYPEGSSRGQDAVSHMIDQEPVKQ